MAMTQQQLNNAYYAKSVIEWRAKGYTEFDIKQMLLSTVEYISFMKLSDIVLIMEIANGERCA